MKPLIASLFAMAILCPAVSAAEPAPAPRPKAVGVLNAQVVKPKDNNGQWNQKDDGQQNQKDDGQQNQYDNGRQNQNDDGQKNQKNNGQKKPVKPV